MENVNTVRDNIEQETGFWNSSYPPARRGIQKNNLDTFSPVILLGTTLGQRRREKKRTICAEMITVIYSDSVVCTQPRYVEEVSQFLSCATTLRSHHTVGMISHDDD